MTVLTGNREKGTRVFQMFEMSNQAIEKKGQGFLFLKCQICPHLYDCREVPFQYHNAVQ